MSVLDVKDLAKEKLPQADFPAPRRADFRVFFTEAVHKGIWRHASENLSVEICGVMVGTWAEDADGPYASITEYIRCDGATQKFAEVTFTHDSWAQINREMDTKYKDLRIIGWYHSHPNFGIFLSDRDGFIQQHFFAGAGQIALVVDPVRKTEGIFVWRGGKTAPLACFWVGDRIRVGVDQATQNEASAATPAGGEATAAAPTVAYARDAGPFGWTNILFGVLLFLTGWVVASQLSAWQRLMMEEGVVAHYGVWKLYKPGFEESMGQIAEAQQKLRAEVARLATLPPTTDETALKEQQQRWAEVVGVMGVQETAMREMLKRYGLQDHEKKLVQQLVFEKLGAARPGPDASATPPAAGAPAATAPAPSPAPSATAAAASPSVPPPTATPPTATPPSATPPTPSTTAPK